MNTTLWDYSITNGTNTSSPADIANKLYLVNEYFLYCYHGNPEDVYFTLFRIFLCYLNTSLAVIGFFLNFLCMAILRKSGLNKPSNILLFALVVSDSMNMTVNVNIGKIFMYFGPNKTKPGYCTFEYGTFWNMFLFVSKEFIYFISTWGHIVNGTIPLIITAERFLAVYFPMTFKKVVTMKSVFFSCLCAYIIWLPVLILICCSRRLNYIWITKEILVGLITTTSFMKDYFNFLYIVTAYVFEIGTSWIPSSFICFGCILIGIRVKIALWERRKMSQMKESVKWSPRTTRTLLTTCLIFAASHLMSSFISSFAPVSTEVPSITYFLVQFSEFVNLLHCSNKVLLSMKKYPQRGDYDL
ncbi:hypothetical protein Btru_030976 [Bulinus truncatus]|nr:hypothetical protein Btru_030976 [Bulinus truncatus]